MKVGDLFVALGFKVDDTGATQFNHKIQNIRANMLKMTAAATAAIWAIDRLTGSTTRASLSLANFVKQTGLSAQSLQKWQFAATMANTALTVDQVTSSVSSLQQALMEIRMGGGNPEAFYWLGVNPMGKDAFQVLKDLSSTVKTLDPAFASMQLSQIGLGADFLNVLQLSNEEIDKLFKAAPQRSTSFIRAMNSLSQLSAKFRLNMQLFYEQIVIRAMPHITKFYEIMQGALGRATAIIEMAIRFGEAMFDVWNKLPGGIKLVLLAIAALKSPLLMLLLILDDISVWMKGGDSLFGRMYEWVEKIANVIGRWFTKDAVPFPDGATGMNAARWLGRAGVKGIVENFKKRSRDPRDNMESDGKGGWMMPDGSGGYYPVGEDGLPTVNDELGRGVMEPLPEFMGMGNVSQNNTINVYGSGDPKTTASAVVNQTQRALNYAFADNSRGYVI